MKIIFAINKESKGGMWGRIDVGLNVNGMGEMEYNKNII